MYILMQTDHEAEEILILGSYLSQEAAQAAMSKQLSNAIATALDNAGEDPAEYTWNDHEVVSRDDGERYWSIEPFLSATNATLVTNDCNPMLVWSIAEVPEPGKEAER